MTTVHLPFHVKTITVLIILLATSTVVIPLGLNQNQIAIAQQQKDKGMIELGAHSPEFTLEKNYTNVKAAVQRFGITYPAIGSYNGRKSYRDYYQAQ